jgi:thiol-disulfide isomerase/thioredoxin/outer membrane lipoprotein-sorting protein
MATTDVRAARWAKWLLAAAGLLSLSLCGCPGPSTAESQSAAAGPLEAAKTAYQQAKTYADSGELHIEITERGKTNEVQPIPFSLSLERPNKLRIDACGASVVCDGKQFWAVVADPEMADQVLYREAPADLSVDKIYSDPALAQMLTDKSGLRLPQLELLLADDPLVTVFGKGFSTKRLEDQQLPDVDDDDRRYQVVEVKGEDGKCVAWIDPKTHALRRLEVPSEPFHALFDPEHHAKFRVWIDFNGAEFGHQIDAKAFEFEAPASARLMKRFVPPPPALREPPNPLLGRRPENFHFTDMDGKTVDAATLEGKVVVLDMWTVSCAWCFRSFPNLEKVFKHYQGNDKVVILTVNNDERSFDDKAVQAAFEKAHLTLPIVRDPEQYAQSVFKVPGWPAMVILGPDGDVQDFELGFKADLATTLPKKIDRLLAGENLADETLAKFDLERQDFDRRKTQEMAGATRQFELPQAKIGERSEPESVKLTKSWTAEGIKNPGNMLVVDADTQPRILVLDGWKKVVELDLSGQSLAAHGLELPADSPATQLRTAVDAEGHRFFALFAPTFQQVHVFDGDWKPLFGYPEGKHAGIADVQFGDLDGDGQLELNVAYFGEVGVQNVSLAGKRLWSNRLLDNVRSLAVLDPGPEKHRQLLCANERAALGIIDYQGKLVGEIPVPNRGVAVIVAADLDGQSAPSLAALAVANPTELLAIGLDRQGHELWSYPLPVGVRNTPCDPLIAGNLNASGPGQWLLTGPDGSIHILAADGTLFDKFAYGSSLTGIGTAISKGQPLLLVATERELVAWKVDPAGSQSNATATGAKTRVKGAADDEPPIDDAAGPAGTKADDAGATQPADAAPDETTPGDEKPAGIETAADDAAD